MGTKWWPYDWNTDPAKILRNEMLVGAWISKPMSLASHQRDCYKLCVRATSQDGGQCRLR